MAFLTIRIKGSEGYTRTALSKDRMVLGRASATDIPVKHTSISREHCAFVKDGDGWSIEDLGSSNSTWVGKVKVAGKQRLAEKDVVKVGHARLTFHAGELSEPEAAVEVSAGDDDEALSGEVRKRGLNDPSEAIPCSGCGAWFSIAHRLSGESMPCPRCGQNAKIPVLS
jgi:predicted component of type VI protein secretion system